MATQADVMTAAQNAYDTAATFFNLPTLGALQAQLTAANDTIAALNAKLATAKTDAAKVVADLG